MHSYFILFPFQAVMLYLNVNSDENYDALSCEEVNQFQNAHRDMMPKDETKEYACGLEEQERPDWFLNIDKNQDDVIQLNEFDKDLANVTNVKELIKYLKNRNGLLTFNLVHP